MDCIYDLISLKLNTLHKDKIFSYQGIDNSMSIYKYANNEFWLLNGRGENDPVNILRDLGIPFKVLKSASEITTENKDRILFFTAKDLVRQLKTVNTQCKQLLFFYSGFYVYELDDEKITFRIHHDDDDYILYKKDFELLNQIITYPISWTYQLIELTDLSYDIPQDRIKRSLLEHTRKFLMDERTVNEQEHLRISGMKMYDELAELLKNMASKQGELSRSEIMSQFFLISSINSGSPGLYRREFASAVCRMMNADENNEITEDLLLAARSWADLGRKALNMFQKQNNKISEEYVQIALPIIENIKLYEINAMSRLYAYLERE